MIQGRRARVDFQHTEKMHACGTLLFAAEVDRINRLTSPKRLVFGTYPNDIVVEQVLQHVGLLGMLGLAGRMRVTAANVKDWRVDTAAAVDGERVDRVLSEQLRNFPDSGKRGLYRGLTEAMTNCVHHAYESSRRDGVRANLSDKRWWMFWQVNGGNLDVAFCDLGMGIPRSLLEGKTWPIEDVDSVLKALGLLRTDASLIAAGFDLRKSSTGESHRGKGLSEIKNAILQLDGSVLLYSNSGAYSFDAGTRREQRRSYPESILGTLIQWRIPMAGAGGSEEKSA